MPCGEYPGEADDKMVVMALDYGERRIGVAVSDPLGIIAQGLETIQRKEDDSELEQIKRLAQEREVSCIVVGLPLRLDGTEGAAARKVRGFVKELKRHVPDVPVETIDERLSSAEAHHVLSEAGATNRVRKRNVDRMSAQLILRRYLERRGRAAGKRGA